MNNESRMRSKLNRLSIRALVYAKPYDHDTHFVVCMHSGALGYTVCARKRQIIIYGKYYVSLCW